MSVSKILVFGASNSKKSINKRLAVHAASILQSDLSMSVEIDLIDLNDFDMPVFSPEREAEGIPEAAHAFFNRIGAADGLIISFAEYNGNFTAAFKNIFDWSSRIEMKIFQDKPVLALATSVGKRGGQNVHRLFMEAAPFFGAQVISHFNFGPFAEHFDTETDSFKTPELAEELREAVKAFQVMI